MALPARESPDLQRGWPVARKAIVMRTIKTWLVLGMVCALAACASKGADRVTDAATRLAEVGEVEVPRGVED